MPMEGDNKEKFGYVYLFCNIFIIQNGVKISINETFFFSTYFVVYPLFHPKNMVFNL
jgi:hypothetical protein